MTPQPYIPNQTYAASQAYIMNPTYIPIPGYALPHVNPSMPGYDPQYSAYAFGDPFYAYPRVPVTPSLLCAYAHMRGRVDQEYDPLHQSLFATPSRAFQSGKLILPLIFKRASMEELPRGATYFWDPILETKTREQVEGKPKKAGFAEEGGARSHTTPIYPKGDSGYESPPPTAPEGEDDIYDDFHLPSPKMDSHIYKEYIKNHPPRCIAPNHYKGDMVFANFGYVNIEGKWVDPESEGELYKAYMNPTEGPNSKIPLPTLRQRSDSGPRIMTPEEQLKFYNEYVMDITDWVDAEGDPRMLRITPATFLRWATGAVKGEHFEETLLAPQENLPDSAFLDGTEDEDNLFKLDHRVQFDLDTRSVLSGQYSPDPNPRPHRNPHGHTDVIRAPTTFAYSYPQAALDLEKAAFGARSNDSTACSPVSTASTPETFTSEKAIISLAQNNIENLATAEAVYEKSRNYILHLREQQQDVTIKEMEEFEKKAKDAAAVRIDLNFEVFAMEAQIEALKEFKPIAAPPTPPTPFARTAIPTPQTTPEREAAEAAEAEDEEVYEPPVHRLRRTKQYKRYLREEIEREKIQCERVKQTDVRLQDDLQDIIDDIEKLKKLKDDLVDAMQKATDDIRAQQENNYRVPRDPPGGLGSEN